MRRDDRRRRGFTMIELLLVLVILGVLAVMVVPRFAGRSEQARETAARTDLSTIRLALDSFELDNGRYPTESEGLEALLVQPTDALSWRGPYLRNSSKLPVDPWGNPYQYAYPGSNEGDFDLYSFGPDGRQGGDDDIYLDE